MSQELKVVQITVDVDGCPTHDESWHLVDPCNDSGDASLCDCQFFGEGESMVMKYKVKPYKRGGITCLRCAEKIAIYKSIKL